MTQGQQEYWVDDVGWVRSTADETSPSTSNRGAAAAASALRPMPCQRRAAEVVDATVALTTKAIRDGRAQLFRRGAVLAMDWVHERADMAPVTNVCQPWPSLVDAVAEYAVAWRIAATPDDFMAPTQRGIARLVAHGVEAYLLWYCFPEAPTPALLDRASDEAGVLAELGAVGGPKSTGTEVFPQLAGTRVGFDATGTLVIR